MCAVFCCIDIVNDLNDRDVVGAREIDGEGAGAGFAGAIGDGVVNGDGACFTFGQIVVGGVSWIEGPRAIGIDD